jgi:putative peptide maturation dehydrogenase
MAAVRRTPYAFFHIGDEVGADGVAQIQALGILTGEQHAISSAELDLLRRLPAERWVPSDGRDPQLVGTLTDKGLLVSDSDEPELVALRDRDEALSTHQWNLYAALYHFMTQWQGVHAPEMDDALLRDRTRDAAQAWKAHFGPAPGEFAEVDVVSEMALTGGERPGGLYDALLARRTTRAFDTDAPMTAAQLDTVLRYVFGCHGYGTTVADTVCIKRTSPSGGALHPIEVYPIITHVTGVPPGIYHYNVRDHALGMRSELPADEGVMLATSFMCGQRYFGSAHVSFVMTARFSRNHWKYRRHQKAYAGILMDAAHLSQTLYLVSGELGLGAFITIAINARDIERTLGLDGVSEGVIAMAGCGPRAPGESPLELTFAPQAPGA